MKSYSTLLEAIDGLRKEGYVEDLNIKEDYIEWRARNFKISPDEFSIDKFFRFDDNSDPDNQSIIYAISSEKHDLKGVLINAYGIYAEPMANKMLEKLRV